MAYNCKSYHSKIQFPLVTGLFEGTRENILHIFRALGIFVLNRKVIPLCLTKNQHKKVYQYQRLISEDRGECKSQVERSWHYEKTRKTTKNITYSPAAIHRHFSNMQYDEHDKKCHWGNGICPNFSGIVQLCTDLSHRPRRKENVFQKSNKKFKYSSAFFTQLFEWVGSPTVK